MGVARTHRPPVARAVAGILAGYCTLAGDLDCNHAGDCILAEEDLDNFEDPDCILADLADLDYTEVRKRSFTWGRICQISLMVMQ